MTGRTWCFSYGAQALKALFICIALQSCHIKVPAAHTTNVCLLHTSMTSAPEGKRRNQGKTKPIGTMPARHEHSHRWRDTSFQCADRHKACKHACDAERHWAVLQMQQDMLHMKVGSVTDLRLSHFSKVVFLRAIGGLALAHELDTVHHRWQAAQQVLHQVAGLVSSLCHTLCIRPENSCWQELLKQHILYGQSCLLGSCS